MTSQTVEVEGREISLSNLDKVLYPGSGTTKAEVIDYYRAVAPAVLPYLRGRPLTMKRYPDGIDRPPFFEKRCPVWRPDWLATASVWSKSNGHHIDYCLLNDLPSLVWASNLASLELHTMLAHQDDPERPSMIVFDLDPGPGTGLAECARVAVWIGEVFDTLDLTTVVKASGSKGLHLHVPLNTPVSYERTKPFAHALAQLVERQHP
ncbi:MAG: DNA polymerase domain-containing protein, partial [Nocardioidaceae bacterium]